MMTMLWAIPSVAVVIVALVYQKLQSTKPQNAVYVIGDLHGDV